MSTNLSKSTRLTNPLHDYQSYSVQYVLLATRTTEDALPFMATDPTTMAATLSAIDKTKKLGEAVPYGNTDTAYLIIDTRRFTQFTINNLKYEVLINGLEKNQSHGNFVSSLSMQVMDSVGVSFINFIRWVMIDKMQTNYDGMLYMLRVLFVGHKPNGETTTVQSVTIPMHLFKMNLDLDHARGIYDMEFMPNINFDTSRHSRWLSITTSTAYTTGKSNRLIDMINNFEGTLNKTSKEYFDKASAALKASGRAANKEGGFGRLVQYMITIPKEWEGFEYTGSGVVDATETEYSSKNINESTTNGIPPNVKDQIAKPPQAKNTSISVPTGTTVTAVLDTILGQVTEISKLGTVQSNGSITLHKYLVGITSTKEAVTVHVDVIPFVVPKSELGQEGNKKVGYNADKFYQEVDGKRLPSQYIEYDYIFTGKNTDVLAFDMKIQDLQWLIASNLDMGPGQLNGVTPNGSSEDTNNGQGENNELLYARAYDPLLPPINTAASLENFSKYASTLSKEKSAEAVRTTQDYGRNLSKFYAASPIIANLTIRGNPDIMTKFNIGTLLPHTTDDSGGGGISANSKEKYRTELESKILKDNTTDGESQLTRNYDGSFTAKTLGNGSYTKMPVFAKVNVHGPNVDFASNDLIQGEQFSTAILQDNFYVVFKVVNIIEGSNFTQQLELYSHNVFGNGKYEPADAGKKTTQVN